MIIIIDSNFALYVQEGKSALQLDGPRVTLWKVLQELSERSLGRITLVGPSTGAPDPLDFVL